MGISGVATATVMAETFEFFVMLCVIKYKKTLKLIFNKLKFSDINKVLTLWLPLSFINITKNLTYLVINWAAANLNVLKLASYQIMYTWFQLCGFALVPIESVALTFIPSAKSYFNLFNI